MSESHTKGEGRKSCESNTKKCTWTEKGKLSENKENHTYSSIKLKR